MTKLNVLGSIETQARGGKTRNASSIGELLAYYYLATHEKMSIRQIADLLKDTRYQRGNGDSIAAYQHQWRNKVCGFKTTKQIEDNQFYSKHSESTEAGKLFHYYKYTNICGLLFKNDCLPVDDDGEIVVSEVEKMINDAIAEMLANIEQDKGVALQVNEDEQAS